MTHRLDPRLKGRDPEFAFMSLRPGIGAQFVPEIASTLMTFNLERTQGDVPVTLRHGNRELPLGRYLRQKLREHVGKEKQAPRDEKKEQEMLDVRRRAIQNKETGGSFKKQLVQEAQGKVASLKARSRIFKKRNSI